MASNKVLSRMSPMFAASFITAFLVCFGRGVTIISAQEKEKGKQNQFAQSIADKKKQVVLVPALFEYRGIKIGMSAGEVRRTLDKKSKISDHDGLYYVFSDTEAAQVVIGTDKKVHIVSTMYFGDSEQAPKATDIFGAETKIRRAKNGSIYKLVRYPEAGYAVIYSRSASSDPTIVVTMQKID